MTQTRSTPIIEMRGIAKQFGSTIALAGVDFMVDRGDIHALVGENGAGKSTLMHILAGVTHADRGDIVIAGKAAAISSVEAASALGIAMVHQHFMLLPSLTVAENLTLGREPRRRGLYDRAAAIRTVIELGERYHLRVDPNARVSDLSVGDLQRLEILRALYRGAEILILDEPTAVLTPQETEGLFRVLRELQADGKTTIFITHKLEEVLAICGPIMVLRDGHLAGSLHTATTTAHEIAKLMVGREVFLEFARPPNTPGAPILEVSHLVGAAVRDVSFDVKAGEIVGIAGVTGNGQSELADLIAGLLPAESGVVRLVGADITRLTVAERRQAGLAYMPEDRYKQGLAADASIGDNLLIGAHNRPPLARRGLLNAAAVRTYAQSLITRFHIKTPSAEQAAKTLSGGNAQRIVVARELAEDKPLIIAAQPTRGIDIAASEFVRDALLQRRNAGAGVLLISADLNEILSISDRILVMYRGRLIGELPASAATEMRLGLLMAGVIESETGVA